MSHPVLLTKLHNLGASENALAWFKSYLSERLQTTRVATSVSSPLLVTHGVPQGSILGPMLFNLYMNDLPSVTKECETESYVDDTKIYLSIQPIDLENGILRVAADLNRIAEWCCSHFLLISPTKTKLILFGVSYILSRLPTINIDFLGQLLTPVPACKDLGLTLDSHLSFNDHISTLTSSLLSSLCQINRVKHLFSEDTLLLIINSLVFSKLFYCSTVWSGTTNYNIKKLQLIQNFAARIVKGLRKYDHVTPALSNLNWLSVERQLRLRDATMIFKCLNHLVPSYLSHKLSKRSDVHTYRTRSKNDLNLPRCRTITTQRSFFIMPSDITTQ